MQESAVLSPIASEHEASTQQRSASSWSILLMLQDVSDMAMGPVFVTQPIDEKYSIIHTITTVMSQHKILQGPLAANVKSN